MAFEQDNSQASPTPEVADEETVQLSVPGSKSRQDSADTVSVESVVALTGAMQQIIDEMRALRQEFDTKIKYDASKERQIDSLHNELQAYRAGLHFKILRPVILDLISMHDDLSRMIESIPREEGMIPISQVLKNLESFQVTAEEILQRNGVEPYSVDGENFVSGRQRALQPVETDEPSLDKTIARRVRKGFEYDEKILRPELVMIYRAVSHE